MTMQEARDAALVSPNRTIIQGNQVANFELNQTVMGQSIGGPRKQARISMWDMMTLYDVNKRRQEDEEAFQAHNKQQKDLKEFYDMQVDHKKHLRDVDIQIKKEDLVKIRDHMGTLNNYESQYENKKKSFLK